MRIENVFSSSYTRIFPEARLSNLYDQLTRTAFLTRLLMKAANETISALSMSQTQRLHAAGIELLKIYYLTHNSPI